jgi:hypothetical protein
MDAALRKEIVAKLDRAFGGAEDASPSPDAPLHVLFTALELPPPWKPSPARALAIFPANWPTDPRPAFYVDHSVVGQAGGPPRNPHDYYALDVTWRGFSWNAAWQGDDPVRAIQLWINRFVTETS